MTGDLSNVNAPIAIVSLRLYLTYFTCVYKLISLLISNLVNVGVM